MLGIRVIGQASEAGELDVICKTRGEHGALERIVLGLKEHGYTNGKVNISHCGNPAAAERLKHMIEAVFEGARVVVTECGGLCSYYAELGGLLIGYEDGRLEKSPGPRYTNSILKGRAAAGEVQRVQTADR